MSNQEDQQHLATKVAAAADQEEKARALTENARAQPASKTTTKKEEKEEDQKSDGRTVMHRGSQRQEVNESNIQSEVVKRDQIEEIIPTTSSSEIELGKSNQCNNKSEQENDNSVSVPITANKANNNISDQVNQPVYVTSNFYPRVAYIISGTNSGHVSNNTLTRITQQVRHNFAQLTIGFLF